MNLPALKPPLLVQNLTTEELHQHLTRAVEMTAQSIAYLAAVTTELERRGVDLSGVRSGLVPFFRSVAAGKLAAEAVVAFAGQKSLLKWLEKKPVEEQRAIAGGAEIVVPLPDGGTKLVAPHEITVPDLRAASSTARSSSVATGDTGRRRGGRPASETPRPRTISFSLTDAEYHEVTKRAAAEGLALSTWVRNALDLEAIK